MIMTRHHRNARFCRLCAKPCRLFTASLLFILLMISHAGAMELDRSTAEQTIAKQGLDYAIIRVGATNSLSFETILTENGMAVKKDNAMDMSERQNNITLLPTAMPFFIGFDKSQNRDGGMCLMGCLDILLTYARITGYTCTGISTIDANHKKVEFEFVADKTEIGRIIGGPTAIKMTTLFELYDDGWRYKEVLWKESLDMDGWNKSYLTRFVGSDRYANTVLWNMHETGIYHPDHASLLAPLEKSDDPAWLDTVAWVYKDGGDTKKAIAIYEQRILPILQQSGNISELKKYQGYLEKIRISSAPVAPPVPGKQGGQPSAGTTQPRRQPVTITKDQRNDLAFQLISETLPTGTLGNQRTIDWNDGPLFGVTPLKRYRYLNKFDCWQYQVVSYESGQAETITDNANACFVQGKWYPYSLLANPQQKMSMDQYYREMIGN